MSAIGDLQYPMLQVFAEAGRNYFMTMEEAAAYNQQAFRSMLYRSETRPNPWVAFRPGKGFYLTQAGRDRWNAHHERNIIRKNPNLPLTAYFDATSYGLAAPKKAAVHVMPKRRRVA